MNSSYIKRLENWYKLNCNGDWEHSYGISIGTLDNPGWHISINLIDTSLENSFYSYSLDNSESDWIKVEVTNKEFHGYGDPNKFEAILELFFNELLGKQIDQKFLYEVYVPINNYEKLFWRPVKAIMVDENTFQIKEIPDEIYSSIKTKDSNNFEQLDKNIDYNDIEYSVNDFIKCNLQYFHDNVYLSVD